MRSGWLCAFATAVALASSVVMTGQDPRTVPASLLIAVAVRVPGAWQVITRRLADKTEIVRYAFIYSDGARTRSQMPANWP